MCFYSTYTCFTGDVFYIYCVEDSFASLAFDTWITGDDIESVTYEIDLYCQELMSLHQGR